MQNDSFEEEGYDGLYPERKDPTRQKSWLTGSYQFEPTVPGRSSQQAAFEAQSDSTSWLTTKDLLMSVPRGLESTVQGVYGLADMLTFDALPDYTNEDRIFGTSETIGGGIAEGLVSFLVPFWALGAAGKAGKIGQFGKWLAKDSFASELVRGGMVDFAAFDANDGRLSDLAKEKGFGNELTEYLETEQSDSEFEGRLKNLIEGGIVGIPVDLAFRGAKMSKQYRNLRKSGASAMEAARSVAGLGEEAIDEILTNRLVEQGELYRLEQGRAIPPEATVPVRHDIDAAAHQSLSNEVGAGNVDVDVWRGTTNQLLNETNAASGLVGEAKNAVLDLVGLIGERYFDDVSVELGGRSTDAGVTGSYQYLSRTVSIFSNAIRTGTVRDDIFHEMWHALEQTLDPKQRTKVIGEFVRQRDAYFAKNLEAAERFESLRTASPSERQALLQQIVAKGEYQYVSPAEWWATMGTASTQKRLDLLAKMKDGGVRKLAAQANIMWSDFVSTLRRVFGVQNAQSMIDGFFSSRPAAANKTIKLLSGLSEQGIDTVYRNTFSLPEGELAAVSEAITKGKEAGLSGIDLAATVPYPQLVNGFDHTTRTVNADTIVGGRGMGAAQLKFAAGTRAENVLRAVARVAYGTGDNKKLAEAYLKSIGIVPTEEALNAFKDMVGQQRKALADMKAASTGKAKSKAKSTVAESVAPEDIGRTAEEGMDPEKFSLMMEDVKEMGRTLKAAGVPIEHIRANQVDELLDVGGVAPANKFINKLRTKGTIDADEWSRLKNIIDERAKEKGGVRNKQAEAQAGGDRTEMAARKNAIELSKDDAEIILSKLTTAEPQLALEGGGGSFNTTVSVKRLSELRKKVDAATAAAEQATKEYGPDDPRTLQAIKDARKQKRLLDNAASRSDEEVAAAVPTAPEKPAAATGDISPATPLQNLENDPTLAAAIAAEEAAKVSTASAAEGVSAVEQQMKAAVEAAQTAKTEADGLVAKTQARINAITDIEMPERKKFLDELRQLKADLPKHKMAARAADENLAKLGQQIELVKAQMAQEAAAAAPAPAAVQEAVAAPAAAVEPDPLMTTVEPQSGPTTASLFPSTSPVAAAGDKPKRVRARRKVEVQAAQAADEVISGTPSNAPAEVVAAVKQAIDENPEIANKLKTGDAGDKIEAVDELADKVEAKAAEPEKVPAPASPAAPAAPAIDTTDLKTRLAKVEKDYKAAEKRRINAKSQEAEWKATSESDRLSKERDELKKQIADIESGKPAEAPQVAAAEVTPSAAVSAPTTPPSTPAPSAPSAATPPAGAATPPPAAATPPAGAATPPAGGATPPPSTPSGHPLRPDGTPRRLPEHIGAANNTVPLSVDDAKDLIWWAENNPATIGPAGINPRNLTEPHEILQAWLMDRIGTMNLSRMDTNGADASFLRTMERYIAGRDLARKGLLNKPKHAYSLKQMLQDGLDQISDETGTTIEELAARLYGRSDDLIEIRAELMHGRMMLHRVNQQVAGELRILSPKLKDGSATEEELLFMLMRIASHGELTGAVNTVASEAGRLLTSLRTKIDDALTAGYNPRNGSALRPAGIVTPPASTITPPPSAATPTPAAVTPTPAPPSPSAVPSPSPAGGGTPPTSAPAPVVNPTTTTPSGVQPTTMTPAAAHADYSAEMRRSLRKLKQMYGQDGLEKLLDKLGGRKHITITISKFEEIMEKQLALGQSVGPLVNKTAKAIRTVGIIDFHNEWWINCLLSAGSTWAGVAGLSNGIVAMMRPLERIVGGGAMAAVGDARGAEAVRIGLNTYSNMAKAMLEMCSLAKPDTQGAGIRSAVGQTFRQGSSVSAPTAFDVANTHVWSRQNLPFVQRMAEKKAAKVGKQAHEVTVSLEWAFDAIRLPQRLILTGDEFFKQLQYRAELHAQIQNSLTKQGIVGPEAAKRARDAMDTAVLNGEFITDRRLLKEGQELAQKTLKNPTADEILDFAENYKNEQWAKASAAFAAGLDPAKDLKNFQQMTKNAFSYARENTMQADPRFKIQQDVSRFVNNNPSTRIVLPFVTTPMNAIIFAGDRSPLGMISAITEWTKRYKGSAEATAQHFDKIGAPKFVGEWLRNADSRVAQDLASSDPARVADVAGRLLVGMTIFSSAYALASGGTITGYGPRNKDERRTWLELGNQPYSIKVPGAGWVSFNRTDPINTLFGTVADFCLAAKYAHTDEENYSTVQTATTSLFFALVNNLTNKSYLQGMAQLVDALGQQDPQAAERAIARHLGSLVPYSSQMRAITDLTDPYKRIGDPDFMDNIVSSVFNQIPGLSDNNLPARDLFGKRITRPERLGPDLFSPITVMPVMNSALRDEMTSLGRAFKPASYITEGGLDLRRITLNSGRNAYDQLQEISGELVIRGMTMEESIIRLIESPAYKQMSPMSTQFVDSPRVLAIRAEMTRYRAKALNLLKANNPELAAAINAVKQQKQAAMRGENPMQLPIYK